MTFRQWLFQTKIVSAVRHRWHSRFKPECSCNWPGFGVCGWVDGGYVEDGGLGAF